MNAFETKLTLLIKKECTGHRLLCQRNIQSRFVTQYADIIVDCGSSRNYIAIECKSMKTKNFYFSRYFHTCQIQVLSDYFYRTGRTGYLAVKIGRAISLLPWNGVMQMYAMGYVEIPVDILTNHFISVNTLNQVVLGTQISTCSICM